MRLLGKRGKLDWLIAIGATAVTGVFVIMTHKRTQAFRQVSPEGFSLIVGQPWIDAGVWLANYLNKTGIHPKEPEEKDFIINCFTELGVDDAGIVRYAPGSAQVQQVHSELSASNITQPVRKLVTDFMSATLTLPAKVFT